MRLRRRSRSERTAPAGRAGDDPAVLRSWEMDSAVAPPRVGWLTKFFLWCAGVDRDILVTRAEVHRYANLGLLVIAIATLGATTFTIFASVVLGRFHVVLIPFALGWGTLILLVDRAIVTEPHYRERKYYICCFSLCERAAAQRGTCFTWSGYMPSPPSGPRGSSSEAGAVVGPARAGLVAAAPV
jgi:Domain of unknown function (DUF4407)